MGKATSPDVHCPLLPHARLSGVHPHPYIASCPHAQASCTPPACGAPSCALPAAPASPPCCPSCCSAPRPPSLWCGSPAGEVAAAVVADALPLFGGLCRLRTEGLHQQQPWRRAARSAAAAACGGGLAHPPPTATCRCPPSRPAAPRRLARCRLSWKALCRPVSCGSTTPPPRAGQMLLTWQSRRFARRMPRPCESGHGAAAP